jgi:hypothetical protein
MELLEVVTVPVGTPLAKGAVIGPGLLVVVVEQEYVGGPHVGAEPLIVIETCTGELGFEALSVACTVGVNVPEALGVPESTPVLAFSDIPLGSEPAVIAHVQQIFPGSDAVKTKPT